MNPYKVVYLPPKRKKEIEAEITVELNDNRDYSNSKDVIVAVEAITSGAVRRFKFNAVVCNIPTDMKQVLSGRLERPLKEGYWPTVSYTVNGRETGYTIPLSFAEVVVYALEEFSQTDDWADLQETISLYRLERLKVRFGMQQSQLDQLITHSTERLTRMKAAKRSIDQALKRIEGGKEPTENQIKALSVSWNY